MVDTAGGTGATGGTGTTGSTGATGGIGATKPSTSDALIFKKDLNEVHLLIDLISGRADRSLSTLSMPDPDDPAKTLTSGEILKRISLMRYPPKDTDPTNATNAAVLLLAKDRLSVLADPARGLSIAYTWMYVDAGRIREWCRRRLGCGETAVTRPTRGAAIDLAPETFPGLQAHARRFRCWDGVLRLLAVLWLGLTALTFWDTTLGRSALEHADQNWKAYIDAARESPELLDKDKGCDIDHIDKSKLAPADIGRTLSACHKLYYLKQLTEQSSEEIKTVFGCTGTGRGTVFHVWCWDGLLSNTFVPPKSPSDPVGWQSATSILSVFTGYVLPMMFALLGTLIGAFRANLDKIGNSSLVPRDLVGMLVGVPVGLVAGAAVGLFLSPSPAPAQGSGGLTGAFTLTASGLGFVAGYASQSFFTYLDGVIGTIFPSAAVINARALARAAATAAAPSTGTPGSATTSATGPTGATAASRPAGPGGATGASGQRGATGP